jgi:hypothetical protein
LFFAALISVACSASCEESTGYGPADINPSVNGFVSDARTNAALAGTTVTVQGRSVMSNDIGFYSINELRSGETQLTAQRQGYQDYTAEVIVESFTMHDIKMEPK